MSEQLPAGRELDALIAEHVMGWQQVLTFTADTKEGQYEWIDPDLTSQALPHYSTDIAAAWLVVQKIESFSLIAPGAWYAGGEYHNEDRWCCETATTIAYGDTAPHAICLAALKAVMP